MEEFLSKVIELSEQGDVYDAVFAIKEYFNIDGLAWSDYRTFTQVIIYLMNESYKYGCYAGSRGYPRAEE